MKNILLKLILLAFVFTACEKDENENKDEYFYEFTSSSKIVTTFETIDRSGNDSIVWAKSNIESGDNLVFMYKYIYGDEPGWIDDEYTEQILFEISPDQDSFSYTDDELEELNSVFEYYCFCSTLDLVKADSGSISGVKIDDNNWQIELNARFTGKKYGELDDLFQKTYSISEVFTKK